MVFAMAAVPVFGAAGVALDYTRGLYAVKDVQTAMDAAVLAGLTKPGSEIATAKSVFAGNQADRASTLDAPTFQLDPSCSCLTGTVTGSIPLTIAQVLGKKTMALKVTSKASSFKVRTRPVTFVTTPVGAGGWYPKIMSVWTKDSAGNLVSNQQLMTYDFTFPSQGWTAPAIGQASSTVTVDGRAPIWGISVLNYNSATAGNYCPHFCGSSYTLSVTSPPSSSPAMTQIGQFRFVGDCASGQGLRLMYEDGGDNSFADIVASIKCTMGPANVLVPPYLVN